MKKFIYLAGPYSHKNKSIMAYRRFMLTQVAAHYCKQGAHVHSPITESAAYQTEAGMEGTWEQWSERDKLILDRCDYMIVLMLPGWDKSVGVRSELEHAELIGLRVFYLDPKSMISKIFESEYVS